MGKVSHWSGRTKASEPCQGWRIRRGCQGESSLAIGVNFASALRPALLQAQWSGHGGLDPSCFRGALKMLQHGCP